MTINTTPPTPEPGLADDATLHRLLDAELGYDPVAQRGFINHLAMGLVAARRLGADDEVLQEWFDDDTGSDVLVPRDRPGWLDPATDEVRTRGAATVVADRLAGLVGAPGSQFFHAVIRLELALDADHPGQVANALHNWATHAEPPGPVPEPQGRLTFREVLDQLGRDLADGGPGRTDRSRPATWRSFRQALDRLDPRRTSLDDVAAAAAAAHAAADGFTTLHLVTGSRATRAVAALADDATREELTRRTAQAVASTWLAAGAPPLAGDAELDDHRAHAPDDLGRANRLAIATGDPHVVKLVYACRLEHEATGDPLYRWLAARQAGAL